MSKLNRFLWTAFVLVTCFALYKTAPKSNDLPPKSRLSFRPDHINIVYPSAPNEVPATQPRAIKPATPNTTFQKIAELDRIIAERKETILNGRVTEKISLSGITEAERAELLAMLIELNRLRIQRGSLANASAKSALLRNP